MLDSSSLQLSALILKCSFDLLHYQHNLQFALIHLHDRSTPPSSGRIKQNLIRSFFHWNCFTQCLNSDQPALTELHWAYAKMGNILMVSIAFIVTILPQQKYLQVNISPILFKKESITVFKMQYYSIRLLDTTFACMYWK